jgi:hypothetical protein
MEILLTTAELSAQIKCAEITIRKWRMSGKGPPYIRCGANVRYRLSDVETWLKARTIISTSEADVKQARDWIQVG